MRSFGAQEGHDAEAVNTWFGLLTRADDGARTRDTWLGKPLR